MILALGHRSECEVQKYSVTGNYVTMRSRSKLVKRPDFTWHREISPKQDILSCGGDPTLQHINVDSRFGGLINRFGSNLNNSCDERFLEGPIIVGND